MIIVFPRSQINRKYEGSGQTPLHLAASCGDQAMIALLLRMGAALGQYIAIATDNNHSCRCLHQRKRKTRFFWFHMVPVCLITLTL